MSEFDLRGWVEGGGGHPFSKTSEIENSLNHWIGGGEVLLGHILKFFLLFFVMAPLNSVSLNKCGVTFSEWENTHVDPKFCLFDL